MFFALSAAWAGAVVAVHALQPGDRIQAVDVHLADRPDAYIAPENLRSTKAAVGRVVLFPIAAGTLVHTARLAPKNTASRPRGLPPGRVSVTLKLGRPYSIIETGDRIDVVRLVGEICVEAPGALVLRRTPKSIELAVLPEQQAALSTLKPITMALWLRHPRDPVTPEQTTCQTP